METLANGVVVPNADGKELISGTGVAEMRALGTSVDAALKSKADIAYVDANAFDFGNIPAGTDVDTLFESRNYYTGGPENVSTLTGLAVNTPSSFLVLGAGTRFSSSQIQIPTSTVDTGFWYRTRASSSIWTPWRNLATDPDEAGVPGAMSSNAARVTAFVQRMGGPVDTGGKGAFALRLDHGYTNYKSKLRDGLLARGIVPGIATNSRTWDLEENAGTTASEVNGWVAAGDIEILNHSATHHGGLDEAGLVDEIVNGRLELEQQLPAAAPIFGFAPPGVSAGWDGFAGGALDGWGSVAAQIVLQSHAYSFGYVGGAQRVLDGTVRQGLGHITLDSYDLASARAAIDIAIAGKTGIQFMLHPRELDKPGKITTADFLALMDYAVAKRSAGQLVTLSPGRMVLADSTRPPAPYMSGMRNVAGLLQPGFTAFQAQVIRSGDVVAVHLVNLAYSGTQTGTVTVMTLPEGVRPPATAPEFSTRGQIVQITQSGVVQIVAPTASVSSVMWSYITTEKPPTTPPGTAI